MSLTTVVTRGPLATINPLAKLSAAFVIAFSLVVTIDWVSAAVALVLEVPLFVAAGLGFAGFFRRTIAVWLAAPLAALTTVLYGRGDGEHYFSFLLIDVSDGSIELGIATLLRLLAIALPAVVLFASVDPTDLADALAQLWHLPSRFVLGALAGIRLMALFLDDWRALELARRARGLGDRGRIVRLFSQAFALLVLSIRRGSKLATAMEARGFGSSEPRTWARESQFGAREWALIAVGVAIAAIALSLSVVSGEFRWILA